MMVEEFITEVLAEVVGKEIYLLARNHSIPNLADLFLTDKKKIYLSYPITAVEKSDPALLEEIQGPILSWLESLFVVFNPMSVEDMPLLSPKESKKIPGIEQLTHASKQLIRSRTIERDYQLIDQSDFVVVLYLTKELSPGVLAEIYYATRNQKPVYMAYKGSMSPFIVDAVPYIYPDMATLMQALSELAIAE
jgi:hypothetical protein